MQDMAFIYIRYCELLDKYKGNPNIANDEEYLEIQGLIGDYISKVGIESFFSIKDPIDAKRRSI